MSVPKFLAVVAGVRGDAATQVPFALQGPITLGGLLLTLGVFGSITWSYAAYRLFLGEPYAPVAAVLVGAIGGVLVFLIDRSLALSVKKAGPLWKTVLQVGGRVALAAGLAWTMSTPVILRLSRTVIAMHSFSQRTSMVDDQAGRNQNAVNISGRRKTVDDMRTQKTALEGQLAEPPASAEYARAKDSASAARAAAAQARAINNPRIANAQTQIAGLRDATDAGSIERRRALQRQVSAWRGAITSADSAATAAHATEQQLFDGWYATIRNDLAQIAERLPEAERQASKAGEQLNALNASSVQTIDVLMTPTLAREYTVYSQITSDMNNPDAASLRTWALAFHLLFFGFEMLPMIIKLTWPSGPVDRVVEALEEEDAQRVTIDSNSRMMVADALKRAETEVKLKAIDELKEVQLQRPSVNHEDVTREWQEMASWLLQRSSRPAPSTI